MTYLASALGKINEDSVVELLRQYLRIPSVSGDERQLAEAVCGTCRSIGMDAHIDRHGNAVAALRGRESGIKLACNAHLDTVGVGEGWTVDPYGAEIKDGKVYGRGAVDDKGQIVAQIMAAKALIDADIPIAGELVLCHVVDEEVPVIARKGTVKMLQDGFTAEVRGLLEKHGANKLSQIDPSEFPSLLAEAAALQ